MTWLEQMRAEHKETLAASQASEARLLVALQTSEARMIERMHELEVNLGERIAKVDVRVAEVKSDLMKWSFVFWVSAVSAIAVLAGVLK